MTPRTDDEQSDDESVTFLATEDEFRRYELASDRRHEYVDGLVRARADEPIRHNLVIGNIVMALHPATKDSGCELYACAVRLRLSATRHYYPDVVLTCESSDHIYEVDRPCLIAEVLTPTTAEIDRGEKSYAYLSTPSLRHYLIIDLQLGFIEHLSRPNAETPWTLQICEPGHTIALTHPRNMSITVDEIFALPNRART